MKLSSTMTTTMSPAEMAVCAFVANNLNAGSNWGSWKPLQQG